MDTSLPEWAGRHRPLFREVPGSHRRIGCHVWTEVGADSRDRVFKDYCGWLVVRGEGSYTDWNGTKWELRPGSFAQYIPGRTHRIRRHDPTDWCECSIFLATSFYTGAVALEIIDPDTPVIRPGLSLALLSRFHKCRQSLASAKHADLHRQIPELLALLLRLRELATLRAVPDPMTDLMTDLIEDAKAGLSADFARTIRLPALVAKYPVSYDHFRRVFKERTGVSPGRFRLLKRIELAELYLAEGGMPIKRVAELLGYADRFIFSRQFKAVTGRSPGEYVAQSGKADAEAKPGGSRL